MAQDFIHDADKRLFCIYDDAATGDVFFCSMQLRNKFLFLGMPTPVSWVPRHALIKPPIDDVKVTDLKNKNTIEYIKELFKVPRTTAEERDRCAVISGHSFNVVDTPKEMFMLPYNLVPLALMDRLRYRLACRWVAPIF